MIKQAAIVANVRPETFQELLDHRINEMQEKGLTVEVQYDFHKSTHTALVIGRSVQ